MHMSLIQWVLPVSVMGLEAAILAILSRRRMMRQFPIFASYLVFNICAFLFLAVAVHGSQLQYFYAFWSVTAVSLCMSFAVLYEVFIVALKPFSAVMDLAKVLFGWAGLFLLATGIITAVATNGSGSINICGAVTLLERSVQLIQCGLLLLLVVFETRLGLSWRNHGLAVALGLGVSAAIGLSASYLRAHFLTWAGTIDLIDSTLRVAVVGFWVFALSLPQPERKTAQDSPKRLILQRWNEALATYNERNTPATVESFLPGIERTVDRVMARRVS